MEQQKQPSGAAVGWMMFAGFMMILAGSFQMLSGLAAIINPDSWKGLTDGLFESSAKNWGWIHLLVGLIVFLAGFGVLRGGMISRIIGVIIAIASALTVFVWLPAAPVWGVCIIAVDIAVIWALTAHGRDVEMVQ